MGISGVASKQLCAYVFGALMYFRIGVVIYLNDLFCCPIVR